MTDRQLHYHLIEYLAITASHFNSGFSDNMTYIDDQQRKRSTLMHNWFLPPKSQFPNGYQTDIGLWLLQDSQLQNSAAELTEFGRRPAEFSGP